MTTPSNPKPGLWYTPTTSWNITRILVGHDSNHGAIPKIGELIEKIEHFNRQEHARLLASNAETRLALELLLAGYEGLGGDMDNNGPEMARAALARHPEKEGV